jgi:hypothetical protein
VDGGLSLSGMTPRCVGYVSSVQSSIRRRMPRPRWGRLSSLRTCFSGSSRPERSAAAGNAHPHKIDSGPPVRRDRLAPARSQLTRQRARGVRINVMTGTAPCSILSTPACAHPNQAPFTRTSGAEVFLPPQIRTSVPLQPHRRAPLASDRLWRPPVSCPPDSALRIARPRR